jgi:D-alanyl-D-alanine carboxypeptidase/D-alanyl-D-alanine-endopeptidase (penicillin-binding protein 4)
MRVLLILLGAVLMASCSPKINRVLQQRLQQTETRFQDHTGFYLFDVQKNEAILEYNADRYFTPASNTKILTLFSSLTILGDSIPALRYVKRPDSLIFWGTGDPSFLNKFVFNNSRTFSFLKGAPQQLYFSTSNFYEKRFGEGWSWDDYTGYYQPERSPFPIYSNLITARFANDELWVEPSRFAQHVALAEPQEEADFTREERENKYVYTPSFKGLEEEWDVPFIVNDSLTITLLEDTLHREVKSVQKLLTSEAHVLFSTPADSVYKVMMQESDNFLAEQLLLQCSQTISDSLSVAPAIQFMQRNHFSDLPDKLRWVDGSGLSRYNLFTPRSIVAVWKKVYDKVPAQRLLPLLATGGVNGTVKNWYKAESPYIFGKTGSLSNNHCLSGYLITKSGKTLIFSFMNSNFVASTSDIRGNMQEILEYIRDNYK